MTPRNAECSEYVRPNKRGTFAKQTQFVQPSKTKTKTKYLTHLSLFHSF